MAPSSLSCESLSPDFGVIELASGDNHKWRRKCKELEKDKEATMLIRLLMAQDDDLQDKLTKRSKVKLAQGIISLFTHLCAYGEMNVELKKGFAIILQRVVSLMLSKKVTRTHKRLSKKD